MTLAYREETALDDATLHEICLLARSLDRRLEAPVERYIESCRLGLAGRKWIHAGLAYDGDELVGYKLGRSCDPRCFESWRGGVKADYRRRGIASELAARQEAWCRSQPFSAIMTRTAPDNAPMLILNLRRGFVVSGTLLVRGTTMNVELHKSLGKNAAAE